MLQNSNVETFIVFRSSTPIVVTICEYLFLNRALPNLRGWMCLALLLGCTTGYVLVDSASIPFQTHFWLLLWYIAFTVDMIYIKHVITTQPMSNWSRVYYTNTLAAPPLLVACLCLREHTVLLRLRWGASVRAFLMFQTSRHSKHSACAGHTGFAAFMYCGFGYVACFILAARPGNMLCNETRQGVGFVTPCAFVFRSVLPLLLLLALYVRWRPLL